jgi:hypothetical protein
MSKRKKRNRPDRQSKMIPTIRSAPRLRCRKGGNPKKEGRKKEEGRGQEGKKTYVIPTIVANVCSSKPPPTPRMSDRNRKEKTRRREEEKKRRREDEKNREIEKSRTKTDVGWIRISLLSKPHSGSIPFGPGTDWSHSQTTLVSFRLVAKTNAQTLRRSNRCY